MHDAGPDQRLGDHLWQQHYALTRRDQCSKEVGLTNTHSSMPVMVPKGLLNLFAAPLLVWML